MQSTKIKIPIKHLTMHTPGQTSHSIQAAQLPIHPWTPPKTVKTIIPTRFLSYNISFNPKILKTKITVHSHPNKLTGNCRLKLSQ